MVTTMHINMWTLALLFVLQCTWVAAGELQEKKGGLCSALVLPQGIYVCKEYVVSTDDGFLLGVQRIGARTKVGHDRKPVFLMHGALSGGDTWVLNPPDQSLGFILADAGYDVWIGNFRTTDFSHGHVLYKPSDKGYWDWSVDELASKDVVAMVELSYRTTNTRVHYVGFSQGTQAAFAALSQGMLVDRLEKIVMMAPIAYLKHITTPTGALAAQLLLDQLYSRLQFYAFSTKTASGREFVDIICAAASIRCFNRWITAFTGSNCCINDSRRSFYDKYETQATSTKNLQHLAQSVRNGTFAKYDYGESENMKRYKSIQPPSYDLSKVPTSKMFLVHGRNDALSDVDDVVELTKQLPKGFKTQSIENYGHVDFIVGYNANVVVYNDIVSFLGH